jgi:hypothetical protein
MAQVKTTKFKVGQPIKSLAELEELLKDNLQHYYIKRSSPLLQYADFSHPFNFWMFRGLKFRYVKEMIEAKRLFKAEIDMDNLDSKSIKDLTKVKNKVRQFINDSKSRTSVTAEGRE